MATDRSNEMTTFASQITVRVGAAPFTQLVLGGAIAAMAEGGPVWGPIPFSVFDQNGGGVIAKDEVRTVRGKRRAARTAAGQPMLSLAFAPRFTDFGTHRDGKLTLEGLAAGQNEIMHKKCGFGMGEGRGGGRRSGRGRNRPLFEEIDRDGDEEISREEFASHQNECREFGAR